MSESAVQNALLVENLEQLEANVDALIRGIHSGSADRAAFADLVKAGVSFYPYQYGDVLAFAPSRFIGYRNNSIENHEELVSTGIAHGSYTNKRIDRILGSVSREDEQFEEFLQNYCDLIGVELYNKTHKFWINGRSRQATKTLRSAINDVQNSDIENTDAEYIRRMAGAYARDANVRRKVILRANGRCEYGQHNSGAGQCGTFIKLDGQPYLEAHHVIKLSEQGRDRESNVIALCANHHREAHFGRNWQALQDEFLEIISKKIGQ